MCNSPAEENCLKRCRRCSDVDTHLADMCGNVNVWRADIKLETIASSGKIKSIYADSGRQKMRATGQEVK